MSICKIFAAFRNSSATVSFSLIVKESPSFKTSDCFDLLKYLYNTVLASAMTKMLASSGQAPTVIKCLLIHFYRQIIFKRLDNKSSYLTKEHIQEAFYIRPALFIHFYISDLYFLHFPLPSNVAHKMHALVDSK